MNEEHIELYLMINEPTFEFNGKEYSVWCPGDGFATSDSDGNEQEFADIHDLLENWKLCGLPFKFVVQTLF